MERKNLRLKAVLAILTVILLTAACGSPAPSAPQRRDADTDTVDPEDIAPEGNIVGSGYW